MAYAIGQSGIPWGEREKLLWLDAQGIKRSYRERVVTRITSLERKFDIVQYGELSYAVDQYPLFVLKSKSWSADKPAVLVTGGVHGYETSGVHGALRFAREQADSYRAGFNFLIAPCVSPWGYETINRWNPDAVDPNRSFFPYNVGASIAVQESGLLQTYLLSEDYEFVAHFDLHETTDTDNSEFRPALEARDAKTQKNWDIPDGFYGVGDTLKPEPEFQKAIIDSVQKITHIAPADQDGQLIGSKMVQFGVINYATRELGLCAGMTDARFVTTTEVYPDSATVDEEICVVAQVAAITGGLDYLLKEASLKEKDDCYRLPQ